MKTRWRAVVPRAALAGLATVAVTLTLHGGEATLATIGFCYLLIVLAAGSLFGFAEALIAALVAAVQYNFYFIPPVGTLRIQDPRNWAALLVFIATAVLGGWFSAAARTGAAKAEQRRLEITRLYALSRAGLLADPADVAAHLERALVAIFGFTDARIELTGAAPQPALAQNWPLRLGAGGAPGGVGTLHASGPPLGSESAEAICGLVAVALERARAMAESGRLQALRESDALKSALLDSVTHDMRTPLTSIKAAVTTLLRATDPADTRELLAVINEESDYLNEVIQNLVNMARIEAGALRPTLRPQPLGPIVEDGIARARIAPERVRLEAAPELPAVAADAGLLSQAVAQLVANAAAYAPEGSPIEVRLRAEDGGVAAEFVDDGPGIPPELRHRVFEKFYRDPAARRARPEGLGMGLAIARGIIEAHQGRIEAGGEPGRGARIRFTLPAVPAEPAHGSHHVSNSGH